MSLHVYDAAQYFFQTLFTGTGNPYPQLFGKCHNNLSVFMCPFFTKFAVVITRQKYSDDVHLLLLFSAYVRTRCRVQLTSREKGRQNTLCCLNPICLICNPNPNNDLRQVKVFKNMYVLTGPDHGLCIVRPQVTLPLTRHFVVGCHCFLPGLRIPSKIESICAL